MTTACNSAKLSLATAAAAAAASGVAAAVVSSMRECRAAAVGSGLETSSSSSSGSRGSSKCVGRMLRNRFMLFFIGNMRFASHSPSLPLLLYQQCDMRDLRTLSIYELRLRRRLSLQLQLAEPQLLLFDCSNVGGVGAECEKRNRREKKVRKNNGKGINLIISSCHGLRCHSASSIALAPKPRQAQLATASSI